LPRLSAFAAILAIVAATSASFAADPPAFLVTEPPLPARLASIDAEWNITFRAGDKLRVVPAKDLASWGRYRDVASGPQIVLQGGSVIRADVLKLDEKSLMLGDATGLGRGLWDESTLPRTAIRAILYQPPAAAGERDKLLEQLASYRGSDDRLLLVGGESIGGVLVAAPLDGRFLPENAKPGQGVFQWGRPGQAEPLSIPTAKVTALQLATSAAPALPQQRPVWLGLADGSLIQASSVRVQGEKVSIQLADGGELTTTLAGRADPDATFWDAVMLIQPASPQVVWLSDLKPLGYKHIPFLSIDWAYATDHSVTGSRLRSAGSLFRKGLGMHTTSRLAYDVTDYRKFEAELALDESAGRRGSVIFKVLLQDGGGAWTTAYESPIIRGGEPPTLISLDLKGATRLALIVEFADRGDELDHANWLNARLLK
jgi:NPCBM/NEW2 domain